MENQNTSELRDKDGTLYGPIAQPNPSLASFMEGSAASDTHAYTTSVIPTIDADGAPVILLGIANAGGTSMSVTVWFPLSEAKALKAALDTAVAKADDVERLTAEWMARYGETP